MTTQNIEIGDFPLPQNTYQVRCIACTFETSSKGNPMYKHIWEIVTPTANWRGKTYKCAGLTFTSFTTLTDKAKASNEKLLGKLKLLDKVSLDPSTPTPEAFLGIGARAVLVGSEKQWKSKEENADGTFTEEVMMDENGKPLVTYQVELHRMLGFIGRDTSVDAQVAF